MDSKEKNNIEYYTIDVSHVVKTVWKHAWLIALCGLLAAAIGFSLAAFIITPTYSSSVKLYVNNSSFSLGNTSFSISSSELTAAQNLVRTYGEILDSRSTLERIIEKAKVDYTWKELSEIITYEPANETEIMLVTVTCTDPNEASKIANTIAEVLPAKIAEVITNASMEVVDSAVPDTERVAPGIAKYTIIGFILGVIISAVTFVVLALMDDTIHDEDYVLKNYDFPILGRIPDILNAEGKSYGYRYRKYQSNGDYSKNSK